MDSGETVVQTRLSPDEYEQLRLMAEAEDNSLEAVLREAVREYVDTRTWPDPEDPFFTVEVPDDDGPSLSATETNALLYGDPAN